MRYTGPKARRSRRHGINLYGSDKYDTVLQRKPNPPGKTPRRRIAKVSEYARQLLEKQKARDMFGLSERQFRRLYREAAKVPGQTGEIMVRFLERRLDNVIYRAGFSVNRIQARQFVGHGHFLIDGTRVTVPSYRLKPGQVIAVRPQSKDSPAFPPILMAHEKYLPPAWLKVDSKELRIEVAADPTPGEVEQSIDMRQIVEFYSRIS